MSIFNRARILFVRFWPLLIGLGIGLATSHWPSSWSFLREFSSFRLFGHTFQVADLGVGWLCGVVSVFFLTMIFSFLLKSRAQREYSNLEDDDEILTDKKLTKEERRALDSIGIKPIVWLTDAGIVWVEEVDPKTRERMHSQILADLSVKKETKQ